MLEESEYGARLSGAEYERRILSLSKGLPPMPTPDQDRKVRRLELDPAIDHRLRRSFPGARRSALWKVQERIEKKLLRLGTNL